ncbi:DNRLRE domain-containing protein [Dyadobacter flavalbus]|uniref:DNRLRE domain-containing protein n=1 Tax=Dyadobacter flavalbus TaxID=2579942 RepID=A0A5M8QS19_9BACT|nr:malectin domain-containing carbohydrate-binding protein [Dyadobacter flavalbus]KAA6438058.1 DNRLRE domain-containing protein [Dyadobacter flavalbus]
MKNTLRFKRFIKSLLALLVFAQAGVYAQPAIQWDKTIGGMAAEQLSDMQQTSDGGYIIGGTSDSPAGGDKSQGSKGGKDFWVVKLSANGTKEWDKTFGGSGTDELTSVRQTADGGYILGGNSNSPVSGNKSAGRKGTEYYNEDYWVVKIDANGTKQWDRSYGGSESQGLKVVRQTSDGGYILGGASTSNKSGDKSEDNHGQSENEDLWIVKIASNGNIEWDRTIGSITPNESLTSLNIASDGGYLLGGWETYDGVEGSYEIKKLAIDGTLLWEDTIGPDNNIAWLSEFQETPDGGYILGGSSSARAGGDQSENADGADYWIVKLNAAREVEWDKIIATLDLPPVENGQGAYSEDLTSIVQTPDGGYLVGGYSESKAGGDKTETTRGQDDFWIVKVSSTGAILWDKTIGGNGNDILRVMLKTTDGGIMIGGTTAVPYADPSPENAPSDRTEAINGRSDYWIVKLAPEQPTLPQAPIRINAGGPAFTTATKKLFIADKYYAGIDRVSSIATGDIPNTSNDILYQSARCSPAFSYNIPVPNGEFSVYLHFAETYFGAPGKKGGKGSRQFHVNMESIRKLTNYDIFAKAGGAMLATAETFTVNVTDGMLNIDFLTGAADLPRVSAIEVLPSPQRTLTFTPVADAFVREEKYANQNFGSDPLLSAKSRGQVGQVRQAYLRFAIPGITNVKSAKLRLYGNNHEADTSVDVNAVPVDDDSWTENGITWNNAPTMGRFMGSHVFVNETLKYWEIDVTQYVAAQAVGDQIVSLGILANRRFLMNFHSKENPSGFVPQLVIVTDNTTNQVTRLGNESEEAFESNTALSSVIYPNPAKEHIMLEVSSGHKSDVDLELTNMAGSRFQLQRPETEANTSRLKVGLPGQLPAGMYLLKVQSKEFSEVLKVLVTE